ncbi:TPA: hypothetical protein ACQ7SR_002860 [Klebsiella pneumoniae]|uniref:hypothetical protein n=1 Tax=Klebsiella pneumoniae TaxID=573 RepID=UPI000D65221E|nr:hypothetical protein [Klebsiella pneumoniae]HCA9770844.1 hypothetical protein [Klebsiella variicola subsp. variicola]HBR5116497.1 hypothetical protein [Klebsiella pneumoniae]HBT5588656.1 HNH endonuclease [Klebsiella pneumoniae]HEC0101383.1 hypothetical protein [Klebsiella pneumoniae]HEC1378070.1 hypothetical protein [Klebsiella pneumoniae]
MDKKFSLLRHKIKESQSAVMNKIISNHKTAVCILCGSDNEITKEHVLPQWSFEGRPEKFLINTKNNQSSNYIKMTVPACKTCNSDLLGAFEDYLKRFLLEKDSSELNNYEVDCVIWWLQYIAFKLQIMDLRSQFLRYKGGEYIPFLSNIPVAMFWGEIDTTPNDVFNTIRRSRRALTKKRKANKYNSLLVFNTTNKSFHFFHKVDDFIFIEMPQVGKAFFLFLTKEFTEHKEAHTECMEIMGKVYNS